MSDDFEAPPLRHRQEIEALKADLAAHKAALADVVERAAQEAWKEVVAALDARLANNLIPVVVRNAVRSLSPPDAAPYAKVLEAARVLAEGSDDPIQEIDNRRALVKALAGIGRG